MTCKSYLPPAHGSCQGSGRLAGSLAARVVEVDRSCRLQCDVEHVDAGGAALHAVGEHRPGIVLLDLTLVGNLFSLASVGSIGGDAARILLLNKRVPKRKIAITTSVMVDHLSGMVAMALMFFLLTAGRFEALLEHRPRRLDQRLLRRVGDEDRRAVLAAEIRALAVQGRGVVHVEKDIEQVAITDLLVVERNLDGFRVAGIARANLLVGRVVDVAAHVS